MVGSRIGHAERAVHRRCPVRRRDGGRGCGAAFDGGTRAVLERGVDVRATGRAHARDNSGYIRGVSDLTRHALGGRAATARSCRQRSTSTTSGIAPPLATGDRSGEGLPAIIEVRAAPCADRVHQREHRCAMHRNLVFDVRRSERMDGADNQPLLLEIAQRFGQHLVRDLGDQPTQLIETSCAAVEIIEADQAPLAANRVQRRGHRAVGHRGRHIRFGVR